MPVLERQPIASAIFPGAVADFSCPPRHYGPWLFSLFRFQRTKNILEAEPAVIVDHRLDLREQRKLADAEYPEYTEAEQGTEANRELTPINANENGASLKELGEQGLHSLHRRLTLMKGG
jgi:hypothetical protein